ncbi:MAG: metalloregulator ArsR/SmtB family transcription factor [Ascidiaceihabitans sp.]
MDINTQNGFRALADPTRRDILQRLAGGEPTIAQLTEHFDMTRAAVKKHLTVLSNGGLITTRVSGRERFNALNPNGFAPMRHWIKFFDQFWGNQLTNLKYIIENNDQRDHSNHQTYYSKINISECRPPNCLGISHRS